jgi:hypothetical protein
MADPPPEWLSVEAIRARYAKHMASYSYTYLPLVERLACLIPHLDRGQPGAQDFLDAWRDMATEG